MTCLADISRGMKKCDQFFELLSLVAAVPTTYNIIQYCQYVGNGDEHRGLQYDIVFVRIRHSSGLSFRTDHRNQPGPRVHTVGYWLRLNDFLYSPRLSAQPDLSKNRCGRREPVPVKFFSVKISSNNVYHAFRFPYLASTACINNAPIVHSTFVIVSLSSNRGVFINTYFIYSREY